MKDKTLIRNENGSVIVLAVVMLVLLTFLGISATRMSTIEVQIAANEKRAVQDLYQAEAGDHYALEISSTWLTVTFLSTAETLASFTQNNVDIDSDGTPDVNVEIRCIESTGTPISGLSDPANDLPLQQHKAPPPAGSGYSLNDYEIRRHGITATSTDGSSIQIGVYKVFNKY